MAMRLLLVDSDLAGIAVEGLDPLDQAHVVAGGVEVADLTLYYGQGTSFESAAEVDVVQFKYSPIRANTAFRVSDAKKTIAKFATLYRDHTAKYGKRQVAKKLRFSLVTNRPIYPQFKQAIEGLAAGQRLTGVAADQARQFGAAAALDGQSLSGFAGQCGVSGLSGSLASTKRDLSMLLVDWSATPGPMARARLGAMRDMVRNKAGYAGTDRNVIRDTDVLAALEIHDKEALLPSPASLVDVGELVEREQLPEAVVVIPTLSKPLLVHAAGGVGKTVFMESIAKALEDRYEVVFFDCFGGGRYRSPEDARHLPKHGLMHIANLLACRGLCDPILPGSDDVETLLRTFRRRLEQSVTTLSRGSPKSGLLILLDAIDNAAIRAKEKQEESFPTLLLESLQHAPVAGVLLVASSRSERIPIGHVPYQDFPLRPFSSAETANYLQQRPQGASDVEMHVAQARSGGNPRILEHLVTGGRGLLDPSEIDQKIELSDLIERRLDHALSEAVKRGYKAEDTDAFLAGLAVLPPPVPLDEYAETHGVALSAIESFVVDLWPLLERTKHGIMFRDEPTETLVRDKYASATVSLRRVAANLQARQARSVYAARALPELLQRLGDTEQLFALAFDDRFPAAITSTVGKRNIRYARLKAAVRHFANEGAYDRLVHLLVELSTIAAVDRRGTDYILESPDLVIAAGDVDATRRLFETHTTWQGTRHARLTIANALSGDVDEASRHAIRTVDWLRHYRQQDRDHEARRPGPEHLDIAAVPFLQAAQGRNDHAVRFVRGWKDWYGYEVGEALFGLLGQLQEASGSDAPIDGLLSAGAGSIAITAAALSFLEPTPKAAKGLIAGLARTCKRATKLETAEDFIGARRYRLQDGLRKASTIAVSLGLRAEAAVIARRVRHKRFDTWSLRDHFAGQHVFPSLFQVALAAALRGDDVQLHDVLPADLVTICRGMKMSLGITEFTKEVKQRLEKRARATQGLAEGDSRRISYDKRREAEEFLDRRLGPLLELTTALAGLLGAAAGKADRAFLTLVKAWADARTRRDNYGHDHDPFFQTLGCHVAIFALWARSDIGMSSVRAFLTLFHEQEVVSVAELIRVVGTMARRASLQELAGEQAIKARSLIEAENDVTLKGSLYADLARAILPASMDEGASHFRAGLDQIDAIGSGDYEFTNELLLLASAAQGQELDERDFHTLTNICELNLTDEPEKFPWPAFGKAMSRVSGCRGLAKLSRWADRSKASLRYTLLPYLTALLSDGKIAPEDALALNRLTSPAELYGCNTEDLAKAVGTGDRGDGKALLQEVIKQFEDNNPGGGMDKTVKTLADIAKSVLGGGSVITRRLAMAHPRYARAREGRNAQLNYRGKSDERLSKRPAVLDTAAIRRIVQRTNPLDDVSLGHAVADFEAIDGFHSLRGKFFDGLRAKVRFSERAPYLVALSSLENLDLYAKLDELQRCKAQWGASTASLTDVYQTLPVSLLQLHADDMLFGGQLSGYKLKEIAELSGVPIARHALELAKLYASPDSSVSAAVWLALAYFMCGEARDGEVQAAIKRLLNSEAAKLSSTVMDGEWTAGAYPSGNAVETTVGLVWRMLGSPDTADRWHAAHSVRCLAKFARWDSIDALVGRLESEGAGPFQAPELRFYYLHARLWLVIALARVAMDYPTEIAKYKEVFLDVVNDKYGPHVLMRHFAARALIACLEAKQVELPSDLEALVRGIDSSPLSRVRKKLKEGNDFYRDRPVGAPKPQSEFDLDYDFHKSDVQYLSEVFGTPGWEVTDRVSTVASEIDPSAKSMYESGGREVSRRYRTQGATAGSDTYGYQLGWHALQLVAGEFLGKYSVTDDWFYDEPWGEWLGRYLLTRSDSRWLADGMDQTPLDLTDLLLEEGDSGLQVTGDKAKLLRLAGLCAGARGQVTVSGSWHSTDGVRVHVSSVLVVPTKAARVVQELVDEEPMTVWLPNCGEGDDAEEYVGNKRPNCVPWIVSPSVEGRLDEGDPLGSIRAENRPRVASTVGLPFGVQSGDPFGRVWTNQYGHVVARSEAWGRDNKDREEPGFSGVRFRCSRGFLKSVLKRSNADLLILVNLERYERTHGAHSDSKHTHTVAVIRVTRSFDVKYYRGKINHVYKPGPWH
jgi:hypothetical protein